VNQIVKYIQFISSSVDADGVKFTIDDKDRLILFYQNYLMDQPNKTSEQIKEIIDKLKMIIHLSMDYVPPLQGLDGLAGGNLSGSIIAGEEKKKWAWGG
jgi:hypothetical protein